MRGSVREGVRGWVRGCTPGESDEVGEAEDGVVVSHCTLGGDRGGLVGCVRGCVRGGVREGVLEGA